MMAKNAKATSAKKAKPTAKAAPAKKPKPATKTAAKIASTSPRKASFAALVREHVATNCPDYTFMDTSVIGAPGR